MPGTDGSSPAGEQVQLLLGIVGSPIAAAVAPLTAQAKVPLVITNAAGVNINLWAGFGMLLFGVLMLLWAFTRPLGTELSEAEIREKTAAKFETRLA